jgi:hypothetical protein
LGIVEEEKDKVEKLSKHRKKHNRRRSLMTTNGISSKPVALEVILPIDATTHILSTQKN